MEKTNKKKSLGLYIHIPFCLRKCFYCDFCSSESSYELRDSYVDSLARQIREASDSAREYEVDTVYIGGGTPTLLDAGQFERIFDALASGYSVAQGAEISCECNPATADGELFSSLRSFGVNRLSIGLQSAQENELRALGRLHSYADFVKTFGEAREAGFDNLSLDIMYGIPEQTMASFRGTLESAVSLSPEHISAYCLKVEEGTRFGKMGDSLILPDEEAQSDMYSLCTELLLGAGYEKYEISNFSKKGRESRHNLRYWLGSEYIGFGAAAHSYFGGYRYALSPNIGAFARGEFRECEREKIDLRDRMLEYVMLRMRLREGVSLEEFRREFGCELFSVIGEVDRFVKSGHINTSGGRCAFTEKGIFLSSYILSELLDFS